MDESEEHRVCTPFSSALKVTPLDELRVLGRSRSYKIKRNLEGSKH